MNTIPHNPDPGIPFESLVDLLPEIVYVNRPDGYTEYSNARWYEYTGMSKEETIGFGWLKALHPDDLAKAKQLLNEGANTGNIPDLEYRFQGADGEYRWFLRRAVARRDQSGNIIGWYGICLEIDQRKKRELTLELVDELTDKLRTIADPDEVLWQAVTAVGDFLQVSRVAYGEIDLERRELKIERDYCLDVPSMAGTYSLDSFSAENIAKSLAGELIINTDNKTDPRTAALWESSYEPIGNRANVTVPLMKEGKLAAVLAVQSKVPREWTDIEIEMLRQVVERTWLAVENARLLRSLRASASRLEATLETITQAERRLRVQYEVSRAIGTDDNIDEAAPLILKLIGEGLGFQFGALWLVHENRNIIRAHCIWRSVDLAAPEFEQMTRDREMKSGEGLPGRVWESGRSVWIVDVAKDANFPRGEGAEKNGLHGAFAFPIVGTHGAIGSIEFFSSSVREPDEDLLRTVASLGNQIGQFIERTQAQRTLTRNEALLTAMADAALDAIVTIDHNGNVVEWNPAAEQTFGHTRKQAIGKEMAALIIPPELRDKHRMGMIRYFSTGDGPVLGRRIEVEAVRADGSRFPVELSITPIASQESPLFTGYLRDITERRRSEDDLINRQRDIERLNERLRNAMLETHHRIRNNLQMIVALTDMQVMEGNSTVPVSELERISGQVRTLAAVHDILTVQSKRGGDAQKLEVQSVIEELARLLRQALIGRKIITKLDRLQITARQGTSLAVIVNELVSNALKNSSGDIHIGFSVNGTHALLKVEDEGAGFPPNFDPIAAANTGLELIHNIAVWDLNAELRFGNRPEGGGSVSIRMPVDTTQPGSTISG